MSTRELSELELDALATGAEPDAEQARILETSESARVALAERQRGFDAFPELNEHALWRRIDSQLPPPRRWSWTSWLPVPALAMAAVVVIAIWPKDEEPGVRLKSSTQLYLHRDLGAGTERLASGARLEAGDRIRFEVDLGEPGFVTLIGIESTGTLYTAWPPPERTPAYMEAGVARLLEGAMALDDSTGREVVHLVRCDSAAPPGCRFERQRLQCRPGCTSDAEFVMQKQ